MSLHENQGVFTEADYWACEYPERPYDYEHTWFDQNCRACTIALGAAAHNRPESSIYTHCVRDSVEALPDAYERERVKHDLPPLPATAAR